jgi:small subunit ribosomal protein S16
MLKIKLARFGKRNQPEYRIVVNEAKDKRDGAYTALLGHYAPTQTPKLLKVDVELYRSWITKGAQPTDTVAALVKRFESGKPFPPKKKQLSQKAKAKASKVKEDAAATKVEAAKPKEEVTAPKEEVVATPEADTEPEKTA